MSSPSPSSSPNPPSVSSTPYRVEEIVTTVRVPVLRPKPAFLRVLQLGGGIGETYTMSQIIEHIKTYIEDRKLYDEQDPRFIYCQNDLLGEALNVTSFTLGQALKLFWENCTLTPDSCLRIKHHVVTTPVESEQPGDEGTGSSTSITQGSTRGVNSSTSSTGAIQQVSTPTAGPSQNNHVSLTACQPSTSVTQKDLENYENEQVQQPSTSCAQETLQQAEDEPKASTSLSIRCDETDGGEAPWSCEVMVERHEPPSRQRVRSHDSLVVECTSDTFSVEYELVSSSEAEFIPEMVDDDESDGNASTEERTEVYVVCQESDIEYLADYSDSDSDSDAELSSEDKWQCNQCKFKNCALYRNCEKCWSIRPDWLPTPSSSRTNHSCVEDNTKHKITSAADAVKALEVNTDSPSQRPPASIENRIKFTSATICNEASGLDDHHSLDKTQEICHSQDSAIGSLVSSQEHPEDTASVMNAANLSIASNESQKSSKKNDKDLKFVPGKQKRVHSSDLSDSAEESNQKRLKKDLCRDTDLKSSDPCVICLTRSKTASIIHGKTGHQVCCYRCAKRLKQQRKSCPICRRPIQKVIRNFF